MINQKVLGKSNINVTSIVFGGAPIGDLFEFLDDNTSFQTIKAVHESGVNFYDTSPLYGFGLSEKRLDSYLSSINRDDFWLQLLEEGLIDSKSPLPKN